MRHEILNLTAIRPGDEVWIKANVLGFYEALLGKCITVDAGFDVRGNPAFDMSRIVNHIPALKLLKVGDRVRLRFLTQDGKPSEIARVDAGEIKHIIDMRAWVDWSSGRQGIHQLPALELDE